MGWWSKRNRNDLTEINRVLEQILSTQRSIVMTQQELANELTAVKTQIAKIGVETGKTLQKVTDLEALLAAGGNTTPEVDAALAALKAQAQATDDLVPDAP